MKSSRIAASFAGAALLALATSPAAQAFPNQYEGLQIGDCASWDLANNSAGPADCGAVEAQYRLIEHHPLAPETQQQQCGPKATLSYHHRTDDGYRLALYCFTYNMTVDSCWKLTDVDTPQRLDCAARQPGSDRITEVFEDVVDENLCSTTAVVYRRVGLTVCVVPN
ncbi:hypothetical protein AB0H76_07260 [Nocardia sp. NPDC050712]|uniref:hypothetical protein n=1 Tax=Nocardia sp. NPDC050712 TaxID=3155518 RepID=UPI0033FF3187